MKIGRYEIAWWGWRTWYWGPCIMHRYDWWLDLGCVSIARLAQEKK